jgi:E3 ubiquitin-protein ligase HUWE1
MLLFTYVRLAHGFSDYKTRLKSVQARLQALSVLIYSNQVEDINEFPKLTNTICS